MKDYLRKYISLSEDYTLKGSEEKQFLFSLKIPGNKFFLTEEQFDFLCMCNGQKTVNNLLNNYEKESRQNIYSFIENLINIDAVCFNSFSCEKILEKKSVKEPRLQAVHFEITNNCNMNCLHCYHGEKLNSKEDLPFAKIHDLIKEMKKLQVEIVAIGGGEPLCRKDVFDIMDLIEENEMRISAFFTNGSLITNTIVDRLKKYRSHFAVYVSLDTFDPNGMIFRGFNEETGKSVLDKVINGIKILVNAEIPVIINTVVNKYNINQLSKMYDFIRDLKVKSWRIGFPKRTGSFKKNMEKIEESWEEIAKACLSILQQHLEIGRPFHIQIEYLYREELFANFEELSDNSFVCDYELRREGCCIKPDGNVVSCAYCTDIPIGNICIDSLEKIWYSPSMQSVKNIRVCDVKECHDCPMKSICGTGCRINAYFLHKDFLNAKDDYACAAIKFFIEKVKPLLKKYDIISLI